MTRQAEGTARTAPTTVPRTAAIRPLLSACLVAALALVLAAACALALAPRAFAVDVDAEVDVDIDAKVEVVVDVEVEPPVDPPEPPAITYTAKVLVLNVSGHPVSGASVTVQGGSSSQTTGSDGTVRVSGLIKDTSYAVSASKAGYRAFSGSFVCQGLAGEVWPVVLQKQSDGSGGSGGSGGSTTTIPAPADLQTNRATVDVRDAEAQLAEEGDDKPDGSGAAGPVKSPKSDATGDADAKSGASEGAAAEQGACPWWWLLLALLVLLVLFFIILFIRRKKGDEEEDVEAKAASDDALDGPSEPKTSNDGSQGRRG